MAREIPVMSNAIQDEWLWGWDPTPGIVSVWAEADGRAEVWRRTDDGLLREDARFRPWILLDRLDDLGHLGASLTESGGPGNVVVARVLGFMARPAA